VFGFEVLVDPLVAAFAADAALFHPAEGALDGRGREIADGDDPAFEPFGDLDW